MNLTDLKMSLTIENDEKIIQKLSELSSNLENAQRLLSELKKETLTINVEAFPG